MSNLSLKIYDIIKQPLITEKSYKNQAEGKYSFLVNPKANKNQIKEAFKKLFLVDVVSISTANYDGKAKRMGKYEGRKNHYKKAIITLKAGQTLEALSNNDMPKDEIVSKASSLKEVGVEEAVEVKPIKAKSKSNLKEVEANEVEAKIATEVKNYDEANGNSIADNADKQVEHFVAESSKVEDLDKEGGK